jgi:hypothetical protein
MPVVKFNGKDVEVECTKKGALKRKSKNGKWYYSSNSDLRTMASCVKLSSTKVRKSKQTDQLSDKEAKRKSQYEARKQKKEEQKKKLLEANKAKRQAPKRKNQVVKPKGPLTLQNLKDYLMQKYRKPVSINGEPARVYDSIFINKDTLQWRAYTLADEHGADKYKRYRIAATGYNEPKMVEYHMGTHEQIKDWQKTPGFEYMY